ncbi:hypothetical protein M0805_004455 [Coniferiporia weirii]|nr:hypothetical protein M0805_004455 [Coniferiporia weirii]
MSQVMRSFAKLTQMRILALPLTSCAPSDGQHTYYYFQTPPPADSGGKPSLLKRVTGKATEIWADFGKAPEGSWKQRAFKYGERAVDRIDFEELALKSMDPSLGPKIALPGGHNQHLEGKVKTSIPLIYPAFYASKVSPLQHLQSLLERRTPTHRRGFYFWILVSPLTAPFMLIPIIPNLPFFFCVWRSWHHYKAYKASSYLESLIKGGMIKPEGNAGLDKIYEKYRPQSHSSSIPSPKSRQDSSQSKKEHSILSVEAVSKLASFFELPSNAEADLLRALDQTGSRLEKGRV